ncbi:MAG: precorrin-2 C(20)-methyltransferase [Eggerthellaceae bacterium]|nr:precorrin-2 C(20)-methyltransferase [Eggerthellaceae bacterium]
MATGKLYGVSVGPGDPELLTLKAARILREADVIASPNIGTGMQTALRIVGDYIQGKEILDCSSPMTRDKAATAAAYDVVADKLAALLDDGKTVAFITLGDAGVYSTYYYVHTRMVARGYDCEVVAGVTSFSAASARLGIPLCEGAEQLLVVPVTQGSPEAALDVPGTKVFMKSGRELLALRDTLREHGVVSHAQMVNRCGLDGEMVVRDMDALDEDKSYMAVVILKEG